MSNLSAMINGFDASRAGALDAETQALIARRARVLGPAYKLFYEEPVHFVRGEGVYLYDEKGRPYLDAYNNVPVVGHCHPKVVHAIARQAATLNTHTRYLYESIIAYAEQLLATFPAGIGNVMFTCTGSEASDLALRIARFCTGATGVIVTENAYHGITTAAAEISPSLGRHVPIGEHIRTVPAPDRLRSNGRDLGESFAADVQRAIDDLERHGIRFAGMVADSAFSSDGLLPDPAGFLKPVVEVVRRAGGLYIADEVQPGFARTGAQMWGFQRHGIVPDLVVMGKPMGNGLPIAAVGARPALLAEFGGKVRYFNTFGGNPVCIAAAQAVLDVIAEEKLQDNARDVGAYLLQRLKDLAKPYPVIADVRGAGLYMGVEFVTEPGGLAPDGATALRIVNALRRRRVLISAAGKHGNVLKIRPPLPFGRHHADEFVEALGAVLKEML